MIFPRLKIGFCVVASTFLCACGGGGASSPTGDLSAGITPMFDKYVGNWASDCQLAVGGSEMENVTYTKISGNTLDASSSVKFFAVNNCTGAFTTTTYSYTMRFDGTKVAGENVNGPIVVDKVTLTISTGQTYRDIAWVFTNGTFRNEIYTGNGSAGASVDSEGYPNSLEMSASLARPI
jgi:hypothetical protein